ncbi:MAG TPA: SAF domain-containing protein, partial [Usitatibacter sp.]|nr:SAF domain-containing protein [Usitatibacter sp.]
ADRMGLVAARDLQPGDVVDRGAVRFAFPALGIPVEAWDEVAGRRLRDGVGRDEPLLPEHLLPLD